MSAYGFQPQCGPILVDAEVTGPVGSVVLKLVLDAGATTSLLNLTTLLSLRVALLLLHPSRS